MNVLRGIAATCIVLTVMQASLAANVGERLAQKQSQANLDTFQVPTTSADIDGSILPAQTPPMGWNSWYALGSERGWDSTNEQTIKEMADALVATGLADAGYRWYASWNACQMTSFSSSVRNVSYPRALGLCF